MSKAIEVAADNELAFFFETSTDAPMPAAPLLFFISEVERIAKTKRHFGPDAIVELLEVRTGSKSVRLSINQKIAIAGVAATALVGLPTAAQVSIDIHERLVRGNGRLATCVAEMSVDHGVIAVTSTGGATCRVITRDDMPAVKKVLHQRMSEAFGQQKRSRIREGPEERSKNNWHKYFFEGQGERGAHPPPELLRPAMPGTTGRAVLAEPGVVVPDGLGKNLGLMGRFVKVAGSDEIVFESGDEVFEVVGRTRRSEIPLDQNVTVTAAISWNQPGTILIIGWTYAERIPRS